VHSRRSEGEKENGKEVRSEGNKEEKKITEQRMGRHFSLSYKFAMLKYLTSLINFI
jgi:hypothetical protein